MEEMKNELMGEKDGAGEVAEVAEGKDAGMLQDNRGVGVVEVILILVVIFTIYMGCK